MSLALRCVLVLEPSSSERIEAALAPWLLGEPHAEPGRQVWSTSLSMDDQFVEFIEVSCSTRGFRVWESETFELPQAVCDCGHALLREDEDGSCWIVDVCPRCEELVEYSQITAYGRDPWTGSALEPGPGVAHRCAVIVHLLLEGDRPSLPAAFLKAVRELGLERTVLDAG